MKNASFGNQVLPNESGFGEPEDDPLSTRRHKILVLIKGLNLGGAERLLVDALPYLDRGQFDYHFAYLMPQLDFLVPQFEANGFPVHCLGMESNYHFPLSPPSLHRLQCQLGFHLFHAHLPMTGILARIVGRWHRIPVVYTEHNLLEWFHPVTSWATALTYGWNDQVFAVSQGVFDSIARLGLDQKTRVMTLLNGVPVEQVRTEAHDLDALRREFDIPEGHLVVGIVAVFSRQKRLHDWLEVAHRIAGERQDVTFLLVGSGSEEVSLRAHVTALGLADRLRMPGFRPDGRRVLGLLDLYLMTSEYEGLPIALLEAMVLSKPVVATAVGGIPELVQNGQEGLLTPVGAVDELARCALRLLADPALRSKMGQRGAKKVEESFHLRTRVQYIETIYREMLQARRPTPDGITNSGFRL
jgi:glycosyltransferase involved in cell wall biosynthesis